MPHSTYALIFKKLLLLFCLALSSSTHAGTEFIPFTGYRLSDEFEDLNSGITFDVDDENSAGFIVNTDAGEPGTQFELLYSKQSSILTENTTPTTPLFDIDIEYLHLGGLVMYPVNESMSSFIGAGIGVTRFSPDFNNYSSETKFSFNLSGGLKQKISEHLGLRIGISFFGTPVNENSVLFCDDGSCNLHFTSDLYLQYEATAGLILRF